MESFRLEMPTCPKCGSTDTKIDVQDYRNLVRIPAAVGSALMIGIPVTAMAFTCTKCEADFKDKGVD